MQGLHYNKYFYIRVDVYGIPDINTGYNPYKRTAAAAARAL
jgi:hypothetical protein